MKNESKRLTKKPDIEIIIMQDGKETTRFKPEAFVSCALKNDPDRNKKLETRFMVFGKEQNILLILYILLEELIKKMGEVKIMTVLQNVMQENLRSFLDELKLIQHANKSKSKNEVN